MDLDAAPSPVASAAAPPPALDRLCQLLVVEQGYRVLAFDRGDGLKLPGQALAGGSTWLAAAIPELAPLAPHFDRILVRSDGLTLEAICLLDRLADPARRVDLGLAPLEEAGEACLRYTGTVSGQKMPVVLKVWELTDAAGSDVDHLRPLRRLALGKKVDVSAWSLQPATGGVWTNASLGGWLRGRRGLQATLRRVAAGEGPTALAEVGTVTGRPWLTWGLVASIAGLFVLQLVLGGFSGPLAPPIEALVASGALNRTLVVEHGQFHRLLSSAFLHADVIHLALNGVALYVGGLLLEGLLGRAWLLAIFGLSVLGGSAASLLLNEPDGISVGASGGIMGMLAAAAVITLRLPYGAQRTSAQVQLVSWLLPALIPLATTRTGGRIDYAGHLGGALVGTALGLVILSRWGPRDRRPRLQRLAAALGAMAGLALAASVGLAYAGRPAILLDQQMGRLLGPDEAYARLASSTVQEAEAALADLRLRYPRDPRSFLLGAMVATARGDPAAAEALLRGGLEDERLLRRFFEDGRLELALRRELALLLVARGRPEEARGWILPSCRLLAESPARGLDEERLRALCRP